VKKIVSSLIALFVTVSVFAEPVQDISAVSKDPALTAEEAQEHHAVPISEGLKLIPKTDQEENKELAYKIDATYPQIAGENLSENAQQFNKAMSELTSAVVQQFKKYVNADKAHMSTLPEDLRKNSLEVDYDLDVVKMKGNTIVSVRLDIEGSQAGRAHPYHNHRVLNFDLETGKVLELNDLFKAKAKYLNAMANYAKQKLDAKLEDKSFIAEGTQPVLNNFRNWNLENDGILITFDEYQVAPYVYGAQEVEVPYEMLKTFVAPGAAIYPCVMDGKVCTELK